MAARKIISINKKDRRAYVDLWANYVKTHRDIEWSRQQNMFINSLMQNAKQSTVSAKEYLTIKNEL